MRKEECLEFLQWALPRLGLRWPGFRKVRKQVQKRLAARIEVLGLDSLDAYRRHLLAHPDEWEALDAMCRISITRFFRDRGLWDRLAELLPPLATGRELCAWSAGCAAGEEPYSLVLCARFLCRPPVAVRVIGTDTDEQQLARARRGRYPPGALKEVPAPLQNAGFLDRGGALELRPELRAAVKFAVGDVRKERPPGRFDLVLCRYLAFTYLDDQGQREVLGRLAAALVPGGLLVLGKHETPPRPSPAFEATDAHLRIYRKRSESA